MVGNDMKTNLLSTEASEANEQMQMKHLWNQQNENMSSVPQLKGPKEISTVQDEQVNPYQDYLNFNVNIKQNNTPAPHNTANRINLRSNSDIMGRFKGPGASLTRQ